MKLNEARRALTARLAAVTDEAVLEADLIMEYATGLKKAGILFSDAELLPRETEAIDAAAKRREAHEPLQYILGRWGFMGLEFYTRPGALIPRQDTETLAEHAVCIIRERGYKTALDICTGTGCIAVSLAVLTDADVEASDISPLCAELARQNATDGVTEATNEKGELFGTERMIHALNAYADLTPREILNGMKDTVDAFVGDAEPFVDMTLLCFTYKVTEPTGKK